MAPERNIEVDNSQATLITTDKSMIVDADPVNPQDGATAHAYPEPVAKLLTFSAPEADGIEDWPDYLATGITTKHIPDLLRMVADQTLRTTDSDEDDPKYWAAVHAWRTLGQLQDVSAVEGLLQQTEALLDHDTGFFEWAVDELPDVYAASGPVAIPILTHSIADPSYSDNTRINAMTGLENISTKHPEHREEIVAFFTSQLERFAQNDPEINGYLILSLAHLKATETLPLITQAIADEKVDTSIIDLEDVEVYFGLRERSIPDLNDFFQKLAQLPDAEAHTHTHQHFPSTHSVSPPRGNKNKVTKKAKAKMEKKSRKQNRGK